MPQVKRKEAWYRVVFHHPKIAGRVQVVRAKSVGHAMSVFRRATGMHAVSDCDGGWKYYSVSFDGWK
jgi:hypothetical protein